MIIQTRVELEPIARCIRCDGNLFAWDVRCPSCGLDFIELAQITQELESALRKIRETVELMRASTLAPLNEWKEEHDPTSD